MSEPREAIQQIEADPRLPGGDDVRFAGYAVLGLPFRSGHLLALRRFPASSVGPAYTSVWHRDPTGRWTMYNDVEPISACNRGFGAAIVATEQVPIAIDWPEPRRCVVTVADGLVRWDMRLESTTGTRWVNWGLSLMPFWLWKRRATLAAAGPLAGRLLDIGRLRLHGRAPNGPWFIARPRRVWMIPESSASLHGAELGRPGPLAQQQRLGDLWLPQRGVFATAESYFESVDPTGLPLLAIDASMQRPGAI